MKLKHFGIQFPQGKRKIFSSTNIVRVRFEDRIVLESLASMIEKYDGNGYSDQMSQFKVSCRLFFNVMAVSHKLSFLQPN